MGENEQRHMEFTQRHYAIMQHYSVADVRSGYGDAAHMCDALAADIEAAHTTRGKVTKQGKALADAVRAAGNVIWAMRDKLPDTRAAYVSPAPMEPPHA